MNSKYILSIDTSQAPTSVALLKNETCLEIVWNENQKETASLISKQILYVVENNLNGAYELDQIVINVGPGSFTGLRVGLATAKGLAMALDIEVTTITMFQALLYKFLRKYPDIKYDQAVILVDAKNNNSFISTYDFKTKRFSKSQRISNAEENFLPFFEKKTCFLPLNQCFIPILAQNEDDVFPLNVSAKDSGMLFDKIKSNSFSDLAYIEPHYIVNNYQLK